MRHINLIVIHCSATRENQNYTATQCREDHIGQGFRDCGYHYYIRRNGICYPMRPESQMGAHAKGYNQFSIGVCYEGGLDEKGKPKDTRTPEQKEELLLLLKRLRKEYPDAVILGHRDLSPDLNRNGVVEPDEWLKICPCFDVAEYDF